MRVIRHHVIPLDELFEKLRRVRLKGTFGDIERPFVYRDARLSLQRNMDIDEFLYPPQRYVLRPTVHTILELAKELEKKGVDIFALEGALYFWRDGMDPDRDNPIPFLPPIVEESEEPGDHKVFLVNDGMHRTYSARSVGRGINVVLVQDVPPEYPYYAYAIMERWSGVQEFDELPPVFEKKKYRDPTGYKRLFRQFNEVFPGVQEERKDTNPSHIKA